MLLLLQMSEACVGMSTEELLAAFAMEQGSGMLTTKQLLVLLLRMCQTISALRDIEKRFSALDSSDSDLAQRRGYPGHEEEEADFEPYSPSAPSALGLHRSASPASPSPLVTTGTIVASSPGDLMFSMQRHLRAIAAEYDRRRSNSSRPLLKTHH